MPMIHRLTARFVETAKPGKYCDGANLWLQVKPPSRKVKNGGRSWIFRYKSPAGKTKDMGLGSAKTMTLNQAREKAEEAHAWLKDFKDPIVERERKKAKQVALAANTIEAMTKEFIEKKLRFKAIETQRSAAVHIKRIYETIGKLPPDAVTTAMLVDKVGLGKMHETNYPNSKKLRWVLKGIFAIAKVRCGLPSNPTDDLDALLPSKRHVVKHHPALHRDQLPDFMSRLGAYTDKRPGKAGVQMTSILACKFIVCTGVRVAEVLEATWGEIDMDARVWTIPWQRLKNGHRHNANLARPITTSMMEILQKIQRCTNRLGDNDPVFPSPQRDFYTRQAILSLINERIGWQSRITNHGFRTTLVGWGNNSPDGKPHLVQIQLDHPPKGGKVAQAYGTQNDDWPLRCKMMEAYDQYCNRAETLDDDISISISK